MMQSGTIVLLEGGLAAALPIGLALWELARLRRPPRDDGPTPAPPAPVPPTPERATVPEKTRTPEKVLQPA